jgi:hypothetical protein
MRPAPKPEDPGKSLGRSLFVLVGYVGSYSVTVAHPYEIGQCIWPNEPLYLFNALDS